MSKDRESSAAGGSTVDVPTPTAGVGALVHRRVADCDGSVSMAVVEALAEARGVSPLDIEQPLYDAVDPDALDHLFQGDAAGLEGGRVVFTTGRFEVTVTASDEVYVRSLE